MRRIWFVAITSALAGCAALSGLDQLTTDGGAEDATSVDAGNDVSSDAIPPADGGSDVADTGTADVVASCAYTLGAMQCFQQICSELCCVTSSATACTLQCSSGAIRMACTSRADCTDAAAPTCCLEGALAPVLGCPLVIPADGSAKTACVAGDTCNVAGGAKLCATNADCPNNQTCIEAAFSVNPAKIFGVCR